MYPPRKLALPPNFLQASMPKAVGPIEDGPIDSLSLNSALVRGLQETGMTKGALANMSLPFSVGPWAHDCLALQNIIGRGFKVRQPSK